MDFGSVSPGHTGWERPRPGVLAVGSSPGHLPLPSPPTLLPPRRASVCFSGTPTVPLAALATSGGPDTRQAGPGSSLLREPWERSCGLPQAQCSSLWLQAPGARRGCPHYVVTQGPSHSGCLGPNDRAGAAVQGGQGLHAPPSRAGGPGPPAIPAPLPRELRGPALLPWGQEVRASDTGATRGPGTWPLPSLQCCHAGENKALGPGPGGDAG